MREPKRMWELREPKLDEGTERIQTKLGIQKDSKQRMETKGSKADYSYIKQIRGTNGSKSDKREERNQIR